jgi:hypothetical protein
MTEKTGRDPVLTGIMLLLLALGTGFGTHAVWMASTRLLAGGPGQVEGWMTPRHVISAFGLPRDDLAPVLGLAGDDTPFATLNDLAAARGIPADALLAQVQAAVDRAGAQP